MDNPLGLDSAVALPAAVSMSLHAASIFLAILSRLPLGSRTLLLARTAMLMSMLLVAWFAVTGMSGCWICSGATLGIMMIASLWEGSPATADPLLNKVLAAHEHL